MKQAQSWSFDITLGVIIFLATFVSIFSFINQNEEGKFEQVRGESEYIIGQISAENSPLQAVVDREVNEPLLSDIASLSYDALKIKAGVKNDFCIYFENGEGGLVIINGSTTVIGAQSINVSGTPCG